MVQIQRHGTDDKHRCSTVMILLKTGGDINSCLQFSNYEEMLKYSYMPINPFFPEVLNQHLFRDDDNIGCYSTKFKRGIEEAFAGTPEIIQTNHLENEMNEIIGFTPFPVKKDSTNPYYLKKAKNRMDSLWASCLHDFTLLNMNPEILQIMSFFKTRCDHTWDSVPVLVYHPLYNAFLLISDQIIHTGIQFLETILTSQNGCRFGYCFTEANSFKDTFPNIGKNAVTAFARCKEYQDLSIQCNIWSYSCRECGHFKISFQNLKMLSKKCGVVNFEGMLYACTFKEKRLFQRFEHNSFEHGPKVSGYSVNNFIAVYATACPHSKAIWASLTTKVGVEMYQTWPWTFFNREHETSIDRNGAEYLTCRNMGNCEIPTRIAEDIFQNFDDFIDHKDRNECHLIEDKQDFTGLETAGSCLFSKHGIPFAKVLLFTTQILHTSEHFPSKSLTQQNLSRFCQGLIEANYFHPKLKFEAGRPPFQSRGDPYVHQIKSHTLLHNQENILIEAMWILTFKPTVKDNFSKQANKEFTGRFGNDNFIDRVYHYGQNTLFEDCNNFTLFPVQRYSRNSLSLDHISIIYWVIEKTLSFFKPIFHQGQLFQKLLPETLSFFKTICHHEQLCSYQPQWFRGLSSCKGQKNYFETLSSMDWIPIVNSLLNTNTIMYTDKHISPTNIAQQDNSRFCQGLIDAIRFCDVFPTTLKSIFLAAAKCKEYEIISVNNNIWSNTGHSELLSIKCDEVRIKDIGVIIHNKKQLLTRLEQGQGVSTYFLHMFQHYNRGRNSLPIDKRVEISLRLFTTNSFGEDETSIKKITTFQKQGNLIKSRILNGRAEEDVLHNVDECSGHHNTGHAFKDQHDNTNLGTPKVKFGAEGCHFQNKEDLFIVPTAGENIEQVRISVEGQTFSYNSNFIDLETFNETTDEEVHNSLAEGGRIQKEENDGNIVKPKDCTKIESHFFPENRDSETPKEENRVADASLFYVKAEDVAIQNLTDGDGNNDQKHTNIKNHPISDQQGHVGLKNLGFTPRGKRPNLKTLENCGANLIDDENRGKDGGRNSINEEEGCIIQFAIYRTQTNHTELREHAGILNELQNDSLEGVTSTGETDRETRETEDSSRQGDTRANVSGCRDEIISREEISRALHLGNTNAATDEETRELEDSSRQGESEAHVSECRDEIIPREDNPHAWHLETTEGIREIEDSKRQGDTQTDVSECRDEIIPHEFEDSNRLGDTEENGSEYREDITPNEGNSNALHLETTEETEGCMEHGNREVNIFQNGDGIITTDENVNALDTRSEAENSTRQELCETTVHNDTSEQRWLQMLNVFYINSDTDLIEELNMLYEEILLSTGVQHVLEHDDDLRRSYTRESWKRYLNFRKTIHLLDRFVYQGYEMKPDTFPHAVCKRALFKISLICIRMMMIFLALEMAQEDTTQLKDKGRNTIQQLTNAMLDLWGLKISETFGKHAFTYEREMLMELGYALPRAGEKILKNCLCSAAELRQLQLQNGNVHVEGTEEMLEDVTDGTDDSAAVVLGQSLDHFVNGIIVHLDNDLETVLVTVATQVNMSETPARIDRFFREVGQCFQELKCNINHLAEESWKAYDVQGDTFPLPECHEILLEVGKETLQISLLSVGKQLFHPLTPDRVVEVESSVSAMRDFIQRYRDLLHPPGNSYQVPHTIRDNIVQLGRDPLPHVRVESGTNDNAEAVSSSSGEEPNLQLETNNVASVREARIH